MVDSNPGYSVYDQQEQDAQNSEQSDLNQLIAQYQQRLTALGAPQGVTNNWYSALGTDLTHSAKNPFSTTNAYGGKNPGGMQNIAGLAGLVAGGGLGGGPFGLSGRKAWRHAQADAERKQQQIEQTQAEMQDAVQSKIASINANRNQRNITNLSQMVSGMFDNPQRQALYNQVYQTNLASGTQQVQDAYKEALTKGVTRAADQGLLGGTVDTQRRADLAATRDQGAAQAATAAQGQANQLRSNDQGIRAQLMSMIQSGDPTQAAMARQQLALLQTQIGNVNEGAQGNQLQWNYNDYANQLQSQALGSGIQGFTGATKGGLWGGSLAGASGSGG